MEYRKGLGYATMEYFLIWSYKKFYLLVNGGKDDCHVRLVSFAACYHYDALAQLPKQGRKEASV